MHPRLTGASGLLAPPLARHSYGRSKRLLDIVLCVLSLPIMGPVLLVVLIDVIVPDSVTYFEELLFDVDPSTDLHVLLGSPGGDGETAVRLTRSA